MSINYTPNSFRLGFIFLCALSFNGCGGGQNKISTYSSSSASNSSIASSSSSSSSQANLRSAVDTEIKIIMEKASATAVTLAIAKNGTIEYEQAYGFQDEAKTVPLKIDALMRAASIIKPVTAAAIRKLARDEKLSLSDRAFCNGSNAPCWLDAGLLTTTTDPQAKDITIDQLLTHTGGWYRDVPHTPQNPSSANGSLVGASEMDFIRYNMSQPLDYTPGLPDGIHDNYSNFGYLLLSLVIEQATHVSYVQYVQADILSQLGISAADFNDGSLTSAAREPFYIETNNCIGVPVDGKVGACINNGAAPTGVGLTITTARAMALFAQAYKLPYAPLNKLTSFNTIGEPLVQGTTHSGFQSGNITGTTTFLGQHASGRSYAVFVNINISADDYKLITQQLDALIN
jgi:CubicO group peptidase (beta-lactamase class C family)